MGARIAHVVVLMLENRSFDQLLGLRPGVNGLAGTETNLLDPARPPSPSNPAFQVDGAAPWAVLAGQGPAHSVNATSVQLCGDPAGPSPTRPAAMNGFVQSYAAELAHADHVPHPGPDVIRVVMQAFAPGRLPSLSALADAFCVCDRWHADVPGPTEPNRLFAHAATSFGFAHNVWQRSFSGPTVFGQLQQAGLNWATYDHDVNEVRSLTEVAGRVASFRRFEDDLAADVRSGSLPAYAFVIPRFLNAATGPANSQHAPQDVRYGDHLVADVYEALRATEAVWASTLLVVVHDEHGGFHDHVPPPDGVPDPDGLTSPPPGDVSYAPRFDFTRLGVRVPAVVVSPWVRAGRVDTTLRQHASIPATLRSIFGLPRALTRRDAAAAPLDDLLDLPSPRTDAPLTLPRAPLPPLPAVNDPAHPANLPLDRIQREMVMGVRALTAPSHPEDAGDAPIPATQGAAHAFVRSRYARGAPAGRKAPPYGPRS